MTSNLRGPPAETAAFSRVSCKVLLSMRPLLAKVKLAVSAVSPIIQSSLMLALTSGFQGGIVSLDLFSGIQKEMVQSPLGLCRILSFSEASEGLLNGIG